MSLNLFFLPDELFFAIISEWMEIFNAGFLDSAMCNHERRGKLLELYVYSSFHQNFCKFPLNSLKVHWIAFKLIKLNSISFLVENDEQLICHPVTISNMNTELISKISVCSMTDETVNNDFFAFLFACCPSLNELIVGGFDNDLVDILNCLSVKQASQLCYLTIVDWGFESTSGLFLEKLILDCHSLRSVICDSMIEIAIEQVAQLISANENLQSLQFVAEEDAAQSLSFVQYISEVNKDDEIVGRSIEFIWVLKQSNEDVSQVESFFKKLGKFTAVSFEIRNSGGKCCFDWMRKLNDKSPNLSFLNIANEHQSSSSCDLCASLSLFRHLTTFKFVVFTSWSPCDILKLIAALPASISKLDWTHKTALNTDVIKNIFNNLNQLQHLEIRCLKQLDIKSIRKEVVARPGCSLECKVLKATDEKQHAFNVYSFVVTDQSHK
jgi:hypothetical protein